MTTPTPADGPEAREIANLAKALGPDENSYSVSPQRIPLPDGIELAADLYQPDLPEGGKPRGLLYVLTPYGRNGVMALINAGCFAAHGFAVLLVSCRGTAGSGGTFVAAMHEQADTQAVVQWIRAQPWYPGRFATFGPSYLGYTQWALLRDPPADLVASVILCAVYDHALLTWHHGAYKTDRLPWAYIVARQDEVADSSQLASVINPAKLMAAIQGVPFYDAAETFFEGRVPYQLDFMRHPDVHSGLAFWEPAKHHAALTRVNAPLLLRSGWYDIFTSHTTAAYAAARSRGVTVYLTLGSWTHTEACGAAELGEVVAFLDEHVAGRTAQPHRPLPVRVYVTGAEEWRDLPAWPPSTKDRTFYLDGESKTLSATEQPPANAPPASFTYDPANNPTPTIGGPLLARGGRVDDSAYASRQDVLVYTSAPLDADLELMGVPRVQLAHATNAGCHADLWVRLSEVDAEGVSHNLTENWQALDAPGYEQEKAEDGSFSFSLIDRAHVFKRGTRVRLIVAGGSFPLFVRNPGTGENRTLAKELKAVTHTVQHAGGISKLILPCSV